MGKMQKLDQLVGRVDALLQHLPVDADPTVRALRDKLDETIFETWTVVARESVKPRPAVGRIGHLIEASLGTLPRIGATAAIGAAIGYVIGRSLRSIGRPYR